MTHVYTLPREKYLFQPKYRHESNKKRVWKLFQFKFTDAKERYDKIMWRKGDFRDFPGFSGFFNFLKGFLGLGGIPLDSERNFDSS